VKTDRAEGCGVCGLYVRCGSLSAVSCYSNLRGKLLEARLRRGSSRCALLLQYYFSLLQPLYHATFSGSICWR
jgi:hypothetical protein